MAAWGRKEDEQKQSTESAVPVPKLIDPAAVPGSAVPRVAEGPKRAVIGPTLVVKGEIRGAEDLVIEGKVEGAVRLTDHHLFVGRGAQVQASVEAKSVRIEGVVHGDVQGSERVELAAGATLVGDISAPRVIISDGAKFKGAVDMERGGGRSGTSGAESRPAAVNPEGPPKD